MKPPPPLQTLLTPDTRSITLDKTGEIFCVVDADLYEWLMQWKWHLYDWKGKQYAKRRKLISDPELAPKSIYMHRAIAQRFLVKPTPKHFVVDHKRGNGLDNRLSNLRWATPRDNRLNLYGMWWQQKDFFREL